MLLKCGRQCWSQKGPPGRNGTDSSQTYYQRPPFRSPSPPALVTAPWTSHLTDGTPHAAARPPVLAHTPAPGRAPCGGPPLPSRPSRMPGAGRQRSGHTGLGGRAVEATAALRAVLPHPTGPVHPRQHEELRVLHLSAPLLESRQLRFGLKSRVFSMRLCVNSTRTEGAAVSSPSPLGSVRAHSRAAPGTSPVLIGGLSPGCPLTVCVSADLPSSFSLTFSSPAVCCCTSTSG